MKTLTILFLMSVAYATSVQATLVFDGTITDSEWTLIDDNTGGPGPGFGAGHEVNALYASGDASDIFLGIAGNVQSGNRILVFLDTKTSGGYNTGDYGRTGAPGAAATFNSATQFDALFLADYILSIGTDGTDYFFDLFTMAGTAGGGGGSNAFLGTQATAGLGANPLNGSTTRGFEVTLSKAALGYTGGDIQAFALYSSDGGFLSNQFISPAGGGDGNYGDGPVTFGAATPNPVTIGAAVIPEPSTAMLLLVTGLAGLAIYRRKG